MAQDEGLDDPPFPEPLGALGGVPAPPRPAEEPPTSPSVTGDATFDDRRSVGRESRLDRLIGWVQWAAAPLGFFVFLVALTAFGLLKDEPTTDAGNVPAASVSPPTSATAETAVEATTVPEAPSTTAAPPTTEPPTTEPPPTQPPMTEPPAPEPPPEPASGSAEADSSNRGPRFGPVCGYRPGQTVRIRINGEPAPPVTADADGCVSVNR